MSARYLLMLAVGWMVAGDALAGDGETLMMKGNCTICHAVDKVVVGPSFRAVATKYKGNKGAQAALERKVRNGGNGVWGKLPMPATSKSTSNDDIRSIVQWVLSLR